MKLRMSIRERQRRAAEMVAGGIVDDLVPGHGHRETPIIDAQRVFIDKHPGAGRTRLKERAQFAESNVKTLWVLIRPRKPAAAHRVADVMGGWEALSFSRPPPASADGSIHRIIARKKTPLDSKSGGWTLVSLNLPEVG